MLQTDCRFETLNERVRTLLPPEYRDSYEDIEPVSMGAAPLVMDAAGRVAWDRVWGSFCDLAMAGGPPHKGQLLEAASAPDVEASRSAYEEVVAELCRGIGMVTGLDVSPSQTAGWIRVAGGGDGMIGWMLRAITMENVSVRLDGAALLLPAGPGFRVDKEIKNVVTAVAKTHHYWTAHIGALQRRRIVILFEDLAERSSLVEPSFEQADAAEVAGRLGARIHASTGLVPSDRRYHGWLGLNCPSVRAAVWMIRLLIASNVLSRREGSILFVPIDPKTDPGGDTVWRAMTCVHRLAVTRSISPAEGSSRTV